MKTLIVTFEYLPQIGGIASYVYNLAAHLPSGDVMVYAPIMPGDEVFDKQNAWRVYRMKPYYNFLWPRWLKMYFQIKKIVKKEKIERLMVHHALPSGYVGYLLRKTLKIPYLIFLHGTDLELALKRKRNKLALVCRNAEKVIVNSEFLKNKLSARIDSLPNIQVVYPAPGDAFIAEADAVKISALRSQLALEGKKVVLTVARFADGKGFPHFIRMLPPILLKVPNLVWLIIGDGPKKQEIVKAVQKSGLQNVARFLGPVPYSDLPVYYHLADVFALLTHKDEKTEEGWGSVYMEAAASGIPVIAGSVGGVDEAVENLVTGVLVDSYQESQVVSAVSEILTHPDYAKKMGEAARNRVIENFTWEKQIRKITV